MGGTSTPLVGDFDSNGATDILWYHPETPSDPIWWFRGRQYYVDQGQDLQVGGSYSPIVGDFDGDGASDIFWYDGPSPPSWPNMVVGRHVFYNNSAFDHNNPAANADDDRAVAPDKRALLPGQTATFANYTSYSGGINGLMIDFVDFNRDARVNATDMLIARNHPTHFLNALQLITVAKGTAAKGMSPSEAAAPPAFDWLAEYFPPGDQTAPHFGKDRIEQPLPTPSWQHR